MTHVYGLTEVYGPAALCAKQAEWASLPLRARARLNARQGVVSLMQDAMVVLDPDTMFLPMEKQPARSCFVATSR